MNNPESYRFSNSDEWISIDGNIATLGVSDYAQQQLSDVVFVEITVAPGEVMKKNDHIATIESVKAAADVNVPVSGKVIEINESLSDTPELINSAPFTKAWMVKFEITDPAELATLMDAKAYTDYCSTRSH